jgi:hypothetical protein
MLTPPLLAYRVSGDEGNGDVVIGWRWAPAGSLCLALVEADRPDGTASFRSDTARPALVTAPGSFSVAHEEVVRGPLFLDDSDEFRAGRSNRFARVDGLR